MLDRVVIERPNVSTVLEDTSIASKGHCARLKTTGTQWEIAEDLLKALKALHAAITALSPEQNSSVSPVFLITVGLLQHTSPADVDGDETRTFRQWLTADLTTQFPTDSPDSHVYPVRLASAVNPWFKDLQFLKPEDRRLLHDAQEERAQQIQVQATYAQVQETSEQEKTIFPDFPVEPPPTKLLKSAKVSVMNFLLGEQAANIKK